MAKINNNPILNIKTNTCSYNVQTIGDPHLGRIFRTGVSTSNFGVREKLVLKDFETLLNPVESLNIDFIIIMGDLFDKFIVKPSVVDSAVTLIEDAVNNNTDIVYFIIPGNHDLSKDKTKISSYHLFNKIFETNYHKNLNVIFNDSILHEVSKELYFYLDAYDPFHKDLSEDYLAVMEEIFEKVKTNNTQIISFGHWDNPKNDFAHYLPSDLILKYSDMIVSGHIHTPEKFQKDKIKYIYTGSLQPYSHAEDPNSTYYKTILYTDLEKLLKKSHEHLEKFKYLNVRVNCYPGYLISEPLDCLSLTYNNIIDIPKEINENLEVIEVTPDSITDFTSLYLYKLKYEYEVEEEIILKINNFLKDNSEDVSFTLDKE